MIGGYRSDPDRPARSTDWLSWAGGGYLVLCLLVGLNPLFVSFGWPFPHAASLLAGAQVGARGLSLLAVCGVLISIVAVVTGTVAPGQRPLLLALSAWVAGPALSLLVLGSLQDGRYWAAAASGLAVGFASTTVRPDHLANLLRVLGWVFGWGSVVAGVSQLIVGWPSVLIPGDPRHVQLLAHVGIRVDSITVLNGLSPGRIFLSMTCGLLLVMLLRQPRLKASRWTRAVMLAGLVLAMVWSAGRVGLVAVTVGVLASLIPWRRWPRWVAFSVALAIPVLPLVASQYLRAAENSAQWRFDLWTSYLARPGLWSPFGLGPLSPSTPIRGHAHNQILETLAVGGWVGLAGLVAFLYLGLQVARNANDNSLTYSVIFAVCGISAFDVVTFAPTSVALNSVFVLAVAVVVNAASPSHQRLLSEPSNTGDG